eukprot:COSAG01_NODE_46362_length_400_cov_9.960133_1_plen_80_part_00
MLRIGKFRVEIYLGSTPHRQQEPDRMASAWPISRGMQQEEPVGSVLLLIDRAGFFLGIENMIDQVGHICKVVPRMDTYD